MAEDKPDVAPDPRGCKVGMYVIIAISRWAKLTSSLKLRKWDEPGLPNRPLLVHAASPTSTPRDASRP